jgi:sugar phosphate isomerase/epimerase
MSSDVIRFGAVSGTFSADPRIAARASRDLGFAGLQFDVASPGFDLLDLSGSGRREFRRIFTSQDQEVIGLRADLSGKGFSLGSDVDQVIARFDRVMEAAAGLSAPLVSIDLGPLPAPPVVDRPAPAIDALQSGLILLPESAKSPPPPPMRAAPPANPVFVDQVNGAMAELGRHADRYSVMLAFRSELASFEALKQVLKRADCPWFGIDLDAVALLKDDWDADAVFSELGPVVRHVRARDAVSGADRRTRPAVVGQGSVQWEAVIGNLKEADYRGWITLDLSDLTDRPGAARAGLKYLKSLVE